MILWLKIVIDYFSNIVHLNKDKISICTRTCTRHSISRVADPTLTFECSNSIDAVGIDVAPVIVGRTFIDIYGEMEAQGAESERRKHHNKVVVCVQ